MLVYKGHIRKADAASTEDQVHRHMYRDIYMHTHTYKANAASTEDQVQVRVAPSRTCMPRRRSFLHLTPVFACACGRKHHVCDDVPDSGPLQGQSILFTNDRRVVAREQPNVYVHYMSEAADTIFIDSSGGDRYDTGAGPESFEARPGTSVHPSAYS